MLGSCCFQRHLGDSQVCHLCWRTDEPSYALGYMETEVRCQEEKRGQSGRSPWCPGGRCRQGGWGVTWSSKLVVKPGPNEEFPQPHKLPAAAEKDRGACPRPGAPGTAGLLWPHVACPCPQDRSWQENPAPLQVQGVSTDLTCGSWLHFS